ncbi:MAG: DUF1294 domain-containing protein [Clostridia bacterium]|nr:DUF1294 domain-containing protein [Clostridia bacterium]
MEPWQIALIVWLAALSLLSVICCIYDKIAAKHNPRHRVRESVLLGLSALGGSVAMLICMLIIRHKTKHLRFMLGIPVIILLQAALAAGIWMLAF